VTILENGGHRFKKFKMAVIQNGGMRQFKLSLEKFKNGPHSNWRTLKFG